jgi:uncharacterized protein (DUF305 family)
METHHSGEHHDHPSHQKNYLRLAVMAMISFVAMYMLMYAMVDRFSNVIPNYNQFYMAAVMTAAMVVIEVLLMGMMYSRKKLNLVIVGFSLVVGIGCFLFIRNQTAISDRQFLKSMIPHHAAAVLMVEAAELKDPEVKELANNIITAQEKEIAFMKTKLKTLDD